jgi:hypothetical protein
MRSNPKRLDATMPDQRRDFARYSFGANDRADGRAFITLEQLDKGLEAIGNGSLYLRLRPGVDIKQAEALAQQLNDLVEDIEHTWFPGQPR